MDISEYKVKEKHSEQQEKKSVTNARSIKEAESSFDHHLVLIKLNQRISAENKKQRTKTIEAERETVNQRN